MSTQEERAWALNVVLNDIDSSLSSWPSPYPKEKHRQMADHVANLRGCVPMEPSQHTALLARVARGERALWELMRLSDYPQPCNGAIDYMLEIGFLRKGLAFGTVWLKAAHDFAKRMQSPLDHDGAITRLAEQAQKDSSRMKEEADGGK